MTEEKDYLDRIVDEAALSEHLESALRSADEFDVSHLAQGHSNKMLCVT
jgi:hypothetical protein